MDGRVISYEDKKYFQITGQLWKASSLLDIFGVKLIWILELFLPAVQVQQKHDNTRLYQIVSGK